MNYWLKYLRAWLILKRKSLYKYSYPEGDQYTPFAILCTSRTGSTWLHTLLNSHTSILSFGQVINHYHKKGLKPELEEMIFYKHPNPIKAVGLKIFYGDDSFQYHKYLDDVATNKVIKIIHLVRRNTLAQYTSLKISERSWRWSMDNSADRSEKITLDQSDYKQFEIERVSIVSEISERFESHQFLEVTYEDMMDNFESTMLEIQAFLGVKSQKLFSALKKQSEGELKDQIENWSEFEESL
ncbi:MAG: sulfotransferase [Cyclobacteriaceae bacterium]